MLPPLDLGPLTDDAVANASESADFAWPAESEARASAFMAFQGQCVLPPVDSLKGQEEQGGAGRNSQKSACSTVFCIE